MLVPRMGIVIRGCFMTEKPKIRINPGFILGQLQKALAAARSEGNELLREHVADKANKWTDVLEGVLSGRINVGSRTPTGAPPWATLEVLHGGFSSGKLLAGGPLLPFETELVQRLDYVDIETARGAINGFYLSDAGVKELQKLLESRCYRIDLPEDGALLVVAWLLKHGDLSAANHVLDAIAAHFSDLRFYPQPAGLPFAGADDGVARVQYEPVSSTISAFSSVRTPKAIEAQREALLVWNPLYDRFVALFAETVVDGWPCQQYPADWTTRGAAVLAEYERLRKTHNLCKRPDDVTQNFARMRSVMAACIKDPKSLTGRDVGRVRNMLNGTETKRGLPGSERANKLRADQAKIGAIPSKSELAQNVLAALNAHAGKQAIDTSSVKEILGTSEHKYVPSFRRMLLRCVPMPIRFLIAERIVRSGEQLAKLVPQISSRSDSSACDDSELGDLYAAIYQAFRRRRSLLLLDLAKQVQLNELPWVQVLKPYVRQTGGALEEVSTLQLTFFPEVIIPNKLAQEVNYLAKGAGLDIPIVEELAADIFMGKFSPKFLDAAKRSAKFLQGSLYQTYYNISPKTVLALETDEDFVALCRSRAAWTQPEKFSVAANGIIIEQEQILTTHNLAVLFESLSLKEKLAVDLPGMASRCLHYIHRRQSINFKENWRARLTTLKNTAYAWRQMIFYLSMMPPSAVRSFVDEAKQKYPGILTDGLSQAADGKQPDYCFLGWTVGKHPLAANE
jgi:hypothetical protein